MSEVKESTPKHTAGVAAHYRIDWTEYERGWGSRPDGSTFYATKEDAEAAYAAAFQGRGERTPDCYSNPSRPCLVPIAGSEQ